MTISENIPEPQVTLSVDGNIKTIVTYFHNDDGELMKETNKYKIERRVLPARVAKRKHLKKFGDASNDAIHGNPANTYLGENIRIQLVHNKPTEAETTDLSTKAANVPVFSCRFCQGSHFSYRCPNKNVMEDLQRIRRNLNSTGAEQNEPDSSVTLPSPASGKYIPPALRAAAAAGGKLPPGSPVLAGDGRQQSHQEGYTIRVTNLAADTNVDDLKQIFSSFGRLLRVHPAKDKVTQQHRGFAFITYQTYNEAALAIFGVDGLRHNHVVLNVDWAKPPN